MCLCVCESEKAPPSYNVWDDFAWNSITFFFIGILQTQRKREKLRKKVPTSGNFFQLCSLYFLKGFFREVAKVFSLLFNILFPTIPPPVFCIHFFPTKIAVSYEVEAFFPLTICRDNSGSSIWAWHIIWHFCVVSLVSHCYYLLYTTWILNGLVLFFLKALQILAFFFQTGVKVYSSQKV